MQSNWPLSFPSEETFSHATPFEELRRRIPIRSIIHSEKRCCYRNSVCGDAPRITIFLPCTPPLTKELCHLVSDIQHCSFYSYNRDTLFVRSQHILLLKGTKHQLSVYEKMQIFNTFFMPIFHFSSVSGPIQKDGLKKKINGMHKFACTNKYR